jgi:hypothetical protein
MSEHQHLVPHEDAMESDDDRMAFTQGIRKKLINEMTAHGTQIPADKGEKMVLLAALGDMDKTALANKKIGSQERMGAADRQAALLIQRLSTTGFNTPSGSPFERPVIDGQCERVDLELDTTSLPALELVPGETDVGIATRNFDEFMADTGEQP